MMNTKAVIFDLDGTLLDSLQGIVDAMNGLLERLGFPIHPPAAYKYFVGEGITELVSRALPEDVREKVDINEMVRQYRELYQETWPKKSPPYEGIPRMLQELYKRNIKLAILSNKSDDFTKRMADALLDGTAGPGGSQPLWRFELILGARPGIPSKPDPRTALEISEAIGIQPSETIFVGDTNIDIQTACNAGMFPVGVSWGFRPVEELKTAGAEYILETADDLLALMP
ncbi:MAG: HAD family hydrolase [bacterium]|nr:HAD family hydrolase [bacterium]